MSPEARIGVEPTETSSGVAGSVELDLTRLYLNEAGSIPLLTKAEEVELGHAVQAGLIAARQLAADEIEELSLDKRAELEEIQRAGQTAGRRFVEANLRLVVSVANQYRSRSLELSDVIQEGNLGLLHAVEMFNPDKGFKFSTYATWWIHQAIRKAIIDKGKAIRAPTHVYAGLNIVKAAESDLRVQLERLPKPAELAEYTGMAVEKIENLLAAGRITEGVVSLDEPLGSDDRAAARVDIIADPHSQTGYETAEQDMVAAEIGQLLVRRLDKAKPTGTGLVSREVQAVRLRYGLDSGEPLSVEEVAAALGIKPNRASQIVNRAIEQLKNDPALQALARTEGITVKPQPQTEPVLRRNRLRQTSNN